MAQDLPASGHHLGPDGDRHPHRGLRHPGLCRRDFSIPSGSMSPTLQIGDRITVDRLHSTIHRGDIVVFQRVPADTQNQDADLVKRVIGLPGRDHLLDGNTVLINGESLA